MEGSCWAPVVLNVILQNVSLTRDWKWIRIIKYVVVYAESVGWNLAKLYVTHKSEYVITGLVNKLYTSQLYFCLSNIRVWLQP